MPFIDFETEVAALDPKQFDIVIVGAGAAGIMLAVKLTEARKNVLLIESGHFHEDDDRQNLNELEQSSKPLSNPVWARKRAIGGTTIAWGGQSLPFSPLDFSKRDWVQNSGWPISYDELACHYSIANSFMGIDDLNYTSDVATLLRQQNPGFNPAKVHYHYSKWARRPNFYLL